MTTNIRFSAASAGARQTGRNVRMRLVRDRREAPGLCVERYG